MILNSCITEQTARKNCLNILQTSCRGELQLVFTSYETQKEKKLND